MADLERKAELAAARLRAALDAAEDAERNDYDLSDAAKYLGNFERFSEQAGLPKEVRDAYGWEYLHSFVLERSTGAVRSG